MATDGGKSRRNADDRLFVGMLEKRSWDRFSSGRLQARPKVRYFARGRSRGRKRDYGAFHAGVGGCGGKLADRGHVIEILSSSGRD
jgi:hypothetical protein